MAKKIAGVFVFLFLSILYSCHNNEDENGLNVFRFNITANITSLDPAFASTQSNLWMVNMIFNGLLQVDSNLAIQPCIATGYEISNEGKTYTFHLRNDVFFQDDALFENGKGRKVVAADFAYSFNRIIDPKTVSRGAWIFNDKVDKQNPFVAIDDTTFVIHLLKPFPALPGILTMQYCSVVPHEVAEHYGKDFRSHPIGTGPFRLKVWKEGVVLLLFRNPNYFELDEQGNRLPYLDAVRITFLDSKATEFLKFRQGELDFISDVDPSFKDDVLTKTGELQPRYHDMFKLQKSVYLNTEYIGFNMDDTSVNNPLQKIEVRQAINHAIDKEKMITYLRNGIGIPATHGFVPPGLAGYNIKSVKGYDYNPALVQQLLRKAGYDAQHPMPQITLLCANSAEKEILANYMVSDLQKNGINAKLETMQSKALIEQMVKGNANCFRASWIADYPDAENFLALFYSGYGAPPNYTRFSNTTFDAEYERAFSITNDSARNNLYLQMDSLVMSEAPVCPLYYDQTIRFMQKNISGLANNALNLLDVKRVRKGS